MLRVIELNITLINPRLFKTNFSFSPHYSHFIPSSTSPPSFSLFPSCGFSNSFFEIDVFCFFTNLRWRLNQHFALSIAIASNSCYQQKGGNLRTTILFLLAGTFFLQEDACMINYYFIIIHFIINNNNR
jgi:hypothetical protein